MSRDAAYQFLGGLRAMIEAMRSLGAAEDEFIVELSSDNGWLLCRSFEQYLEGTSGPVATIAGDIAWVKAFGVTIQWPKDTPT